MKNIKNFRDQVRKGNRTFLIITNNLFIVGEKK